MKYLKLIIIFIIIFGNLINSFEYVLSAIKPASVHLQTSKVPLQTSKIIETPFIPPFIYDFVKTNLASTTNQLELKNLPEIIKNIYNSIFEWYNNIPQEKKDKIYQKIELIILALLKAIFDLLEQIIRIIFS